jgi:hypothetical protein
MTTIYLPIEDALADFRTRLSADAHGKVWGDPTGWGRREHEDQAETVLFAFGEQRYPERPGWKAYNVQIACYHPNPKTALQRAQQTGETYWHLIGTTSLAPGLTLAHFRAQHVQVEVAGPLRTNAQRKTGGYLYVAYCTLYCVNLLPI